MRTKSYFVKILKDVLITMIIPIITIIVLCFHMEHVIKEQILLTHENALNQFFELADGYMKEAVSRSYDIAFNEKCQQYLKDTKTDRAYQRVKIIEDLEKYYDDQLKDILVYYPQEDRVISGRQDYGSLELDMYLKVNYQGMDRIAFDTILNSDFSAPTLCVVSNGMDNDYLCVVMRRHVIGSDEKDFLIIQIFKNEFIANILERKLISDGGTLLLFDEHQRLLLSGDNKEYYHLGDYIGAESPFKTNINGTKYMMQVKKLNNIGGFYACAIAYDYFWKELSGTRMICLMGGALCIMVSILIAYCSSKRTYKPIKEMIQKVEKKRMLDYNAEMLSEFEYLERMLEQDNIEKSKLYVLARREQKARYEQFILYLLEEGAKLDDDVDDIFEQYGIHLCSNYFMIALFYIDGNVTLGPGMRSFVVDNVFSELCNQVHMGYFTSISNHMGVMLVNIKKSANLESCKKFYREGQAFLQKECNITVTVALGGVGEGLSGIKKSFQEAEYAMKYKYIMGQGSCIDYLDIYDRAFKYIANEESKLSQIIMGFLNQSDEKKSAKSVVMEVFKKYEINEMSSIELVERFCYELFGVLHKIMIKANYATIEERNELLDGLMKQPTLKQLEKELVSFLVILKDAVAENIVRDDVCANVLTYILDNYYNKELSVTGIGATFKMSSSYLSKLFKKKYGFSILDCIAQTRIKHAKEALKNTNKSIAEISGQVGFLSSQVFVKTFKKYEGITPGIYRDLL